jgi:hypothetical protein
VSFNELERVLSKHVGGSAGGVDAWKRGGCVAAEDGGSAALATLLRSLRNVVSGHTNSAGVVIMRNTYTRSLTMPQPNTGVFSNQL